MTTQDGPTEYVSLSDAGPLIGRSYATMRKWAITEELGLRKHPTDGHQVVVEVDKLLAVFLRKQRRWWSREEMDMRGDTIILLHR